jgi:16S rRNA (guanine966-N2)-methyltransferase
MRIIAGKHKGRSIISPTGSGVRPTSSKMREAMFDTLISNGYLKEDETKVIDLCCGTGALGLEALSRGVASVVFIDGSREHLNLARQNIYYLGEQEKSTVLRADAEKLLNAKDQFDLVFIDPPYLKGVASRALVALYEKNWLKNGAIIVVEMAKIETLKFDADRYQEITTRIYGNSKFVLLESL